MLDTLTAHYILPAADSVAVWGRQASSASDIYGPISSFSMKMTTDAVALNSGFQVSMSWQSGVVLVVLLLLFCYAIYRYGAQARVSFKSIFSSTETIALFENSTIEFGHYIRYGYLLLWFLVAVMVDGLSGGGVYRNSFVCILVLFGVFLIASSLSTLLLRFLSVFDYNDNRWDNLRAIRKIDGALCAFTLALPVIAFAYTSSTHNILVAIVAAVVIIHFLRILIFFHQRGFSFLQSILYLCAVEIAPFALLWGVAVRLNSIHI